MALHQPMMTRHVFPWWLELVGAAIIGAALLFGGLLVAGHSDLLPGSGTQPTTSSWITPELQQFRAGEVLGN